MFACALLGARGVAAAEAARPTEPPTLEALMARDGRPSGREARFREQKQLALLSEPIESRGTLYFVPPDRLCRETTEPTRSRLVIDGDRFALPRRGRRRRGGSLREPDRARVRRQLHRAVQRRPRRRCASATSPRSPPPARRLERSRSGPAHRPLADFIERVTLEGAGARSSAWSWSRRGGDRTTTTFHDVVVDHRFTPEEIERWFALPEAE